MKHLQQFSLLSFAVLFLAFPAFNASAATYYVDINSPNPTPPYTSWATAATNIQDAVNVAGPGSVVLVTNGPVSFGPPYNITNSAGVYLFGGATAPTGYFYRVMVTNPITVESVNGPASTYIMGTTASGLAGCVYLTNGATLSGFTLTNGSVPIYGSGLDAASTNVLVTNCVVTGCSDLAVYLGTLWNCVIGQNTNCLGANLSVLNNCTLTANTGGAAEQCLLNNCVISSNSASEGAGAYGGILNNCLVFSNTAAFGGGAYAGAGYPLVLNNCVISNNTAGTGGGVYGQTLQYPEYCSMTNCIVIQNSPGVYGAVMNNCTLVGNTKSGATESVLNQCTLLQNSGTIGGGAANSSLNNCLIISNSVTSHLGGGVEACTLTNCILAYNTALAGGLGGGADQCALVNCTVTTNSASQGGGIYDCTADNCVLYYNSGGDFFNNIGPYRLNYCCTPQIVTNGLGNITNAPLFVNPAANDFHLQASSPCINSGNNAYITTTTTDLDGNPRFAGGTVDIGTYEYQTPTSVISYAYLQQYGLPTDGSADFADRDGTAFNVYQDWVAGLNPTNPSSVLAMFTPNVSTNVSGITVSWQSVSGILYNLQRSTNLTAQPPFTTIQTNLTGQTGTTSYTDSGATNGVPYFYRVSVVAP